MQTVKRLAFDAQGLLSELRRLQPRLYVTKPLPAGTAAAGVAVSAKDVSALVRSTAMGLLGSAPSVDGQAQRFVLWRMGASELLVSPAGVRTRMADGVIALSIPVRCDQVGDALIHASFFVGSPSRPAGLIATTEERPRGPVEVIDVWGDRLLALAWRILLEIANHIAAESGRDEDGAPLLPAALTASAKGLSVQPMARHAMDRVIR